MNLIDDAFIRVTDGGVPSEVSLGELFERAESIEDLDWSDPCVAAATLGLLTAVAMDAMEVFSVDALGCCLQSGAFEKQAIASYLNEHHDRFELFGDEPFGQVAGLTPLSGEPKSVALLKLDAASGNNVPLFSASAENATPAVTPPEAARQLLATLAFDTAAIKTGAEGDPQAKQGKTTGNPVGPMGRLGLVFPLGRTLFETILLNIPASFATRDDSPVWRRPPLGPSWEIRPARGPLDLLTWPSRRVRLFTDESGRVNAVLVAAGDRLAYVPPFEARTAMRPGAKVGEMSRPKLHASGRAGWRGLAAVLSAGDGGSSAAPMPGLLDQLGQLDELGYVDPAATFSVQLVGVEYGNQSAVVENVISDRTPLPLRALRGEEGLDVRDVVIGMADRADDVMRALNNLTDNLRSAMGGERIPWDKGQRLGDLFVHSLNTHAHRALRLIEEHPERPDLVDVAWQRLLAKQAWLLADPLIEQAALVTFKGHGDQKDSAGMGPQRAEVIFRAALRKALPDAMGPARKEAR